ncbi:shikimate kinase, partial [Nocardia thailandica]
MRVVLIGPPGAGKSTIGRKLARELGVALYDTDNGIEEDTGRTIPDIFAVDGEPEFRRIEEEVVRRAVLGHDGVVSLGGGAVLSAQTRQLLRSVTVVYLEISVAEGLRRTGASNTRPLLNGADPAAKYRELMDIRRPLYKEVASVRVRTDGRSPGRVVRTILARLGLESVRPQQGPGETPSGPAASGAGRPGNNRSRVRRQARARAAAARRGTPATPAAESATTDQP